MARQARDRSPHRRDVRGRPRAEHIAHQGRSVRVNHQAGCDGHQQSERPRIAASTVCSARGGLVVPAAIAACQEVGVRRSSISLSRSCRRVAPDDEVLGWGAPDRRWGGCKRSWCARPRAVLESRADVDPTRHSRFRGRESGHRHHCRLCIALPRDEYLRRAWDDYGRGEIAFHTSCRRERARSAIVRAREAFRAHGGKPTGHNPRLTRWRNRIDPPTLLAVGRRGSQIVPLLYGEGWRKEDPGACSKIIPQAVKSRIGTARTPSLSGGFRPFSTLTARQREKTHASEYSGNVLPHQLGPSV